MAILRPSSHGNAIVPFRLRSDIFHLPVRTGMERNDCICLSGLGWSGTIAFACPDWNGAERLHIVPLSYHFLVVPIFGKERFYLKRSRLNATLQRSASPNNMEQLCSHVKGALKSSLYQSFQFLDNCIFNVHSFPRRSKPHT